VAARSNMAMAAVRDGLACGTVRARGREWRVQLREGDGALMCEPGLRAVLRPMHALACQRLRAPGRDAAERAQDLEELLLGGSGGAASASASAPDAGAALPSISRCAALVAELEAVGWDLVAHVSDDFAQVVLRVSDAAGRAHELTLRLPPDFPSQPPACTAALPEPLDAQLPLSLANHGLAADGLAGPAREAAPRVARGAVSAVVPRGGFQLPALLAKFRSRLERYQLAWDLLDDLDGHVWVLDPPEPTRADMFRRVALGKHSSILIRLAVESPSSVCECEFLGAEAAVAPLRDLFNRGLRQWNPRATTRANLERILAISFPSAPQPAATQAGAGGVDGADGLEMCGICYCVRLPVDGGKGRSTLPDCVCNNTKCAKAFHPSCLQEWLQALPTTRHTLDSMFGDCPYCGESVSVRRDS